MRGQEALLFTRLILTLMPMQLLEYEVTAAPTLVAYLKMERKLQDIQAYSEKMNLQAG